MNLQTFVFVVGFIQLGILTWQDYRNKMWVDTRYVYLMMGVTQVVVFLQYVGVFKLLFIIFLSILSAVLFSKAFGLGAADYETLIWMGLLFNSYSVLLGAVLNVTLLTLTILHQLWHKKILKSQEHHRPYFSILLITWVLMHVMIKLYLPLPS